MVLVLPWIVSAPAAASLDPPSAVVFLYTYWSGNGANGLGGWERRRTEKGSTHPRSLGAEDRVYSDKGYPLSCDGILFSGQLI